MSGVWTSKVGGSSPYTVRGNWNASTNIPDLTTVTQEGYAWVVSVAGSTNLGGITTWNKNDIAVKTFDSWARIEPTSATWGTIVGTLANQTDLQNVLNLKASTTSVNNLTENVYNELSTGLKQGCTITINTDTTKVNISSGYGIIVNNSDPDAPTFSIVNFAGITALAITNIATANATYLAINSSGNVVQQTTPYTSAQSRDLIVIGVAIHSNRTLVNVINNLPDVSVSSQGQVNDLLNGLGEFNIDGNIISPNNGNLNINKSEGRIFKKGSNFINNIEAPHVLTLPLLTAPNTIRYRLQDGTEYTNTNSIDPNNYDNNNVLTPVQPNKFTIQHIVLFPSNLIRIQYGQNVYGSKSEAIQAIQTETFIEEQNIKDNGLLRALLVIKSGTTDLSNINNAQFLEVDRFGSSKFSSGSGGTTTLQQAYNNSIRPQIVTDSEKTAFQVKNGQVENTEAVVEILSNEDKITSQLRGDGASFGNKTDGNYSDFESDGTLKFHGGATVFKDISLSGLSFSAGGAGAPDLINFVDANCLTFGFAGANTTERLYITTEMNHDYKEGTDIEFHVHWTPTTPAIGNVKWQLYYTWQSVNGTYTAPQLLTAISPARGTAWQNTYLSLGTISGAGKTINTQLVLQLFRVPSDAEDTYGADAALLALGIHYECDTVGSRARTSK